MWVKMIATVHGAASITALRCSAGVLLLLACDQSLCRGSQILQTPSGLNPGDHFRFVFVTDGTINATSSDISSYDAFVNAQAGGASYNGATVHWQTIGSTATVNAVDHIGLSTAEVFLASGTEVASSTMAVSGGLWSGSLLNPINQDLTGNTLNELVWTGTAKSTPFGHTSVFPLGFPGLVKDGVAGSTSDLWIANTTTGDDGTVGRPLYGISDVLTVPEPSTFALAVMFGICWAFAAYRRRRLVAAF